MLNFSTCLAPDAKPFHLFQLSNKQGMQILLTDWGATWCSAKIPIFHHQSIEFREVLCCCSIDQLATNQAYLGATIGRFANRIAHGQFKLKGKEYQLVCNQHNRHCLHGGNGFDKRRWQVEEISEDSVTFSLFSADGDQGFAGNLSVQVTYQLTSTNQVKIDFNAVSDQDTPLNLTNHAYFNLDKKDTLSSDNQVATLDIRQHQLQIFADYYLPVDAEGIPSAPLTSVSQTGFDFRQAKTIGQDFLKDLEQQRVKGYDHAFLIHSNSPEKLAPIAILTSSDQKLRLHLHSTQPSVQLYTANFFAGTPNFNGGIYPNYAALALETQALPDTPNHPEWIKYGGITLANQPYQQQTIFSFETL